MVFANDFQGAIGIDLGTTYSCVAAMTADGRVEVIANEQGNRTTPSYVAFSSATERLVGDAAKNQAAMNPQNTVFDAKRLIGRRFDETSVKKDCLLWPFKVVDVDGAPQIKIVDNMGVETLYTPQAISSFVLTKMKEIAEMKLGENVKKAVVTVPAYFNDAQRQATKDAGVIAGLDVLRIINEPTAAAIAYGLDQRLKDAAAGITKKERIVLIFDLGGGTFDVSLLLISDGVFSVKATAGDTHLGGEDFDNAMVCHFVEDFKQRHGSELEINNDPRALRRLRSACERAKRSLSTLTKATIEIDSLFNGIDYTATCTRARFEELNAVAFNSTMEPVRKVFIDAKIQMSDVEDIVLVGGSTRIPKIQSLLASLFGCPVEKLNKSINPDEAVAYGAAVQAAILTGTAGSTTSDLLLHDVVPLSLGVEMQGGIMAVVVPRNTSIPTIMKKMFTTAHDAQTSVEFPIFEGERAMTKENNLLGQFTLSGLPPVPRGTAELETTFEIDANGLLKVTAVELTSRRTANVTITNKPGRLRPEEIERLVEEAAKHREADAEQSGRAEERHSLQQFISSSESQLRNAGLAARLQGADEAFDELAAAMEWLEVSGDQASREELATRRRKVERFVTKAFATIYANQGQSKQKRGGRGNRN